MHPPLYPPLQPSVALATYARSGVQNLDIDSKGQVLESETFDIRFSNGLSAVFNWILKMLTSAVKSSLTSISTKLGCGQEKINDFKSHVFLRVTGLHGRGGVSGLRGPRALGALGRAGKPGQRPGKDKAGLLAECLEGKRGRAGEAGQGGNAG